MKITKAAKTSLESGIVDVIIKRSKCGKICQSGFIKCNDSRILAAEIDNSLLGMQKITSAKVFFGNWKTACLEAVNS